MDNPYVHRTAVGPDMFFGREKELNIIVQRISGKKPLCVSIVGPRRIGKSSLLKFISISECRKEYLFNRGDDFLFVLVNFQHLPYLDDRRFFTYLTKSIVDELSKLNSVIRTHPYQILVEQAEKIRKTDDIFEMGELFTRLVENVTTDLCLKIVFLFDEFENAMPKLSRDVFDYLRTLPYGRNMAYITATRKELQKVCENSYTSNFYSIFSVLNLGLFSKEESVSLIVNPFSEVNIQLREEEINSILKMTGLHPFFIQMYCYYLFDVMVRNRSNKSESINKLFQIDCNCVFKELYLDLSNIEKKMLLDLAYGRLCTESLNIALLRPKGVVDEKGQIFSTSFHNFLLSFDANVKTIQKTNQSADSYEDLSQNNTENKNTPRIENVYISDTQQEVVRVAVAQFCFELTESFPHAVKNEDEVKTKIFSALDIAKDKGTNIICLPELSLREEWISEIRERYSDMIIIGGSFYKDNKNICPVIMKPNINIPYQAKITPSASEYGIMGQRMIPGDKIYKYESRFGKFVILICRDFDDLAHYFRKTDIDMIFCPSFNPVNERFQNEADNHVEKTPSYILIANTGKYGGTSIFGRLNRKYLSELVAGECRDDGDLTYKLCEVKEKQEEVIIADFNLIYKSIQVPTPSDPNKEIRSVEHIKKIPIQINRFRKVEKPKPTTIPFLSDLESEICDIFKSVYQKERNEDASEVNSKTLEFLKYKLLDLTASGKRIDWLDVGCGDGRSLDVLDAVQNRDNIRYHGIDSSYKYLDNTEKRARKYKLNPRLDKIDAAAMKFDSEYDVVSAVLLLHEIDPLCLPYILRNMLQALRGEGTLIISDFQGPYEQEEGVVAWGAEDIQNLLEKIGGARMGIEFVPSSQYPDELGFYRCYVKKPGLDREKFSDLLQGYDNFLDAKKEESKWQRGELRSQIEERVRKLLNRPDIDLKNISPEEMQRIQTEIGDEYGIKAHKIRLLTNQIEFLDDKIKEFRSGVGCDGTDQRTP